MPSRDGDRSPERSPTKKLPMWDSSDPARNPPPLPLNPSTASPTVKTGTSSGIAQAAQLLADKARESVTPSHYTTNPMPERSAERSPERSLIKGATHRRLQSVRDIRAVLDGNRTPERSPERQERAPTPSFLPPGSPETPSKETPSRRPSSRPPMSILGENTPPSATMLALQTMTVRDYKDPPFEDISNNSTPRAPQSFDALLTQISSLTNIATSLQKEMTQLSRRSKDNASDLISLREATNLRDEDIRKSLKDLLHSVTHLPANNNSSHTTGGAASVGSRQPNYNLNATPPPATRAFTLPRIPSPGSLFDDGIGSRIGSPNPYSVEGAASVAMLEKIIREMVTKDGQERLIDGLSKLLEKATIENTDTAKKVADLVEFIKAGPASSALVCTNGHPVRPSGQQQRAFSFESQSGALTLGSRDLSTASATAGASRPEPEEFVSEEMIALLKKIKDSVFHSGAVISEVKAQQRDLRSEVLGIGRNLAQKIDEARKPASTAKAIEDGSGKQDIARIVTEGLSELKTHLDTVMREKRRQSSSSTISRGTVDNQEVYDVVKHALTERGLDRMPSNAVADQATNLDKEAIVDAIKEAYEAYQPNVEIQQIGLERDEILDCLKAGLEEYRSPAPEATEGLNRAEIMETIHEAMQSFNPPRPINEAQEVRDEVLCAVRECLDEYKPTLALAASSEPTRSRELDALPEIVAEAVKSGLTAHGPNATQQLEISADDLFDAVTRALDESVNPLGRFGDEIRKGLEDIISDLHLQFKEYSTAHGRDTEQLLDSFKDGQETLRSDIEQYVDRAQDVTGKDEVIDEIRAGVSHLLKELESSIAAGPQGEARFSMNYVREQFESIQDALTRVESEQHHQAVLTALHAGFEEMRSSEGSRALADPSGHVFGEAVKGEFESVRDTVIMRSEGHKEQILDAVKMGFDILEAKIGDGDLQEVKAELEHLRSTIAGSMGSSQSGELLEDIRLCLDDLKTRTVGEDGDEERSMLATILAEFESLKDRVSGGAMVRSVDGEPDEHVMSSLQSTLDAIKEASALSTGHGMSPETLQGVQVELAKVAAALNNVRENTKADYEEIMTTVRCGLDDLRGDIFKKLDNPETHTQAYGQILDALNEHSETLKTELADKVEKPIDLTVCYDILETLKDGIKSLKGDIDAIKDRPKSSTTERSIASPGNEIVLVEEGDEAAPTVASKAVSAPASIPASSILQRDDLQKMEVMLAALEVKVDAMDANIGEISNQASTPSSVESAATKEDISPIENLLKDMQATLDLIASRETDTNGLAKKDDTDAIETLLRNTKSQLEEMQTQAIPAGVSSEQIAELSEKLETAIGAMSEEMMENMPKKEDLDTVQQLLLDVTPKLEELKSAHQTNIEEQKKSLQTSLDALQLVALEVKEKVLEMQQDRSDNAPVKSDVEQITGLIHDFRDSHDKMRESYEADIGITAKAFDDRKLEAQSILDNVQQLKEFVESVKEEVTSKLTTNGDDLTILSANVNGMEQTIKDHFAITEVVKDLREKVEREFEGVVGTMSAFTEGQDAQTAAINTKSEEVRDAMVKDISEKLDDRFDAMASKYDESKIDSLAATAEQKEIIDLTKQTSDDLRISVDTLGVAITGVKEDFETVTKKLSEDSATVFTRIDDGFSKIDNVETRTSAKAEHEQTREDVSKITTVVEALQADVTEYHPRFMVTLEEIREIINQQFEHVKQTKEQLEERDRSATEASRSLTEEIKSTVSGLPALLPAPVPTIEAPEKYDDTEVHAKLDDLTTLLSEPRDSAVQLDRLDKIHQQVLATAAEVSTFVSTQTRLLTEGHESKEREAADTALVLERRLAEKEHLESDITSLTSEKESLRAIVSDLRAERDALVGHKARLAADVSSLHTALSIRKDELHAMDAKADALERRILEGIMDQSRALLMSRGISANAGRPRAPSNASTLAPLPNSAATSGLSMALKTRAARRAPATPNSASRRILSLSQITHNTPTGAHAYRPEATLGAGLGAAALKRSQSVRSQGSVRKSSWGGVEKRRVSGGLMDEDDDKENSLLEDIRDEDEEDVESTGTVTIHEGDGESQMADGESSLGDESERRTSAGSAVSYSTGEYFTESEISRRSSDVTESMRGESEDEEEQTETESVMQTDSEVSAGAERGGDVESEVEHEEEILEEDKDSTPVPAEKKLVLFQADADSGIGSEIPTTAVLSGSETDYFRRTAEEEASSAAGV
ncbi:hypothetical protein BT63DRAFT_477314 [Microthyrium microscopicum]|uniref:Chromosome segregation ATPase family protein n=1 Tax=Microthyrium microscopicum TaxID=703497 RepID=A0A6A6UEJ6_9PEZI|nr:hypothetical protein BT63DRAFT_477314 [Microthyrium microscopicum]